MIHFLTGKPGAGKGVIAVHELIRVLAHTDCVIVCDLAVKLTPWVRDLSTGSIWARTMKRFLRPERGLLAYLTEKYGQTFWAEKRIKVIPETESGEFYLHRMSRVTGEWIKLDAVRDKQGRVESFDTSPDTYPTLYITDECWRTFGARDWQNTSKGIIFYAAQHRKFSDEWFLTAQHTKQIETQLRQLAQDFWVVRNHGKMRVGPFRQPDMMTVTVYDQAPTGSNQVTAMERRVLRLDKKGIGSCFDTSGGTGVGGGRSADINEKKRGIPFVGLCAAAALVIVALWNMPNLAGMAAEKVFGKMANPNGKIDQSKPKQTEAKHEAKLDKPEKANVDPGQQTNKVREVEFAGYAKAGSAFYVMFSDGSIRQAQSMVQELADGKFYVDGKVYERARPPVSTNGEGRLLDVPLNTPIPPQTEPAPPTMSVYYFGRRESEETTGKSYENWITRR